VRQFSTVARDVRVAPQVARVLRINERAIVLGVDEGSIVDGIGLDVVISEPINYPAAALRIVERD